MSYILDALRKADAQRERDPARGIHAQPLGPSTRNSGVRNAHGSWFWGAVAVGLAALAAAAWYLYQDRDAVVAPSPARVAPATSVPAAGPVPGPAAAPVVGAAILPPPAPAPAPVAANAVEPPAPMVRGALPRDPGATSPPTMRGGPQPQPGAIVPPAGPPTSAVPPSPPPPAFPAAAAPAPAAAPPAAVAPPPTPAVAGLPPDAPKLVISGGVYSTNPAQRMLIVNGQVFNEGSEVGPGVVLVEIKSKTAVLGFRGARYTVGY